MIKRQDGVLWPVDHRSIVAINQTLMYIGTIYEAEWAAYAQSSGATKQDNKSPEEESVGWQPKKELELNALSLMGASLTAIRVNKLIGQRKLQPANINQLLVTAGDMCGLLGFTDGFRDSSDLYTLMYLQSKQAKEENKQAFTYIDFTRTEVICPWYTDEAVDGVSTGITEEFKLAADNNTSGIMASTRASIRRFRRPAS